MLPATCGPLRRSTPAADSTVDVATSTPLPVPTHVALAAAPVSALASSLPTGPISSAYGWRQDPLTGAPRFHAGVDIALPTGRDVVAVEHGRVVFAGAQPDFGNTTWRTKDQHS